MSHFCFHKTYIAKPVHPQNVRKKTDLVEDFTRDIVGDLVAKKLCYCRWLKLFKKKWSWQRRSNKIRLQDGYKVEKMRSIRWIVSTKETYSMRANIIVKENRLMMMDPSFFFRGEGDVGSERNVR
jgi:hypothetical protein